MCFLSRNLAYETCEMLFHYEKVESLLAYGGIIYSKYYRWKFFSFVDQVVCFEVRTKAYNIIMCYYFNSLTELFLQVFTNNVP